MLIGSFSVIAHFKNKGMTRWILWIGLVLFSMSMGSCRLAKKHYLIGVDSSWYPLELMGKESNVSAFSIELLKEISKVEGIYFKRVNKNWDDLLKSLLDGECDGVLTSFYPYIFRLSQYRFSKLFLQTGPVLIVRARESIDALGEFKGKEIVVDTQANKALFVQLYPGSIVRYYASIPKALNQLINNTIDGVLVGVIPANTFVQNLYFGKVKIALKPLDNRGLRLVTLPEQDQELIDRFNKGLEKVRKSGSYDALLKKWNLSLNL